MRLQNSTSAERASASVENLPSPWPYDGYVDDGNERVAEVELRSAVLLQRAELLRVRGLTAELSKIQVTPRNEKLRTATAPGSSTSPEAANVSTTLAKSVPTSSATPGQPRYEALRIERAPLRVVAERLRASSPRPQ